MNSFFAFTFYAKTCTLLFYLFNFNFTFIKVLHPHIFLTSLLEYNCFTVVCYFLLYNKVNQLYIYPHISSLPPILPIPPLYVVTEHRADLPVLCSCFPLAIYFTFSSVYMSMLLSHFVQAYNSPLPLSSTPFSMSVPYSCPAPRITRTIFSFLFFFQIPYICVSIQYLFFSF